MIRRLPRRSGRLCTLFVLLLAAACTTTPLAHGPATTSDRAADMHEAGLERVVGHNAADLVELFGDADLDQREGASRRLQFVGAACVLDAYLSPPKDGREPVVSYVDARLPSGDDIDRASCIAALTRRPAAR